MEREKLTIEKVEEIFNDVDSKWEGDNTFKGLQIIAKYTDNLIRRAGHDIIWSADIDEMIEAGMTEEDIVNLSILNWMLDEDDGSTLVCFV